MTDSALKLRITDDMKTAMRAKDAARLGVIRLVLSEIKQREVDERISLDDTQVYTVLNKMIKQRRDSLEQFKAGNRQDLADQESFEPGILQTYLPAAMGEAEVDQIIKEAITTSGDSSIKDMGALMSTLRPKLQGRTDMSEVSKKIKALLTP
ncbi:MAG: GatB/YqeY domain-containing protein [Gammaproteobacteria bacterium]|nr:GatB/YqeY domain-containing protein [Gammaproteobacteria bacterium]